MPGELVLPSLVPMEASRKEPFEKWVAEYQQLVLRTAYRLLGDVEDARDVAQEVFLRLLTHSGSIAGNPQAWLYRVTVNVCNDHYRRRIPPVELEREPMDPGLDPEQTMAVDERKRLLAQGLTILSQRERAALVLRDIEGLATHEVAEILGVEEVTVRSHVASARLKLAKYVRGRR